MGASSDIPRLPIVVGVNHQTGGLGLRDKLFVEDAQVPGFLAGLKGRGLDQAIVISTCDRIDVVTAAADPDAARVVVVDALAVHGGLERAEVDGAIYLHAREDAVRHLFRVCASLDSVVVGEPQVLGQVKACHRLARDAGAVPGELESLMQSAYASAKRVRTETDIGERPVSIAAVAASVARDVHGDLSTATGLVLGTGDMGELVGDELRKAGLGRLTVCDAGPLSAMALAAGLEAEYVPTDGLAEALAEADVIISAVGGRRQPLTADMVRAALKARRYRPQFIVDASLPRDVEPAVDRIDDAFLYDLADLERLALDGQAGRRNAAEAAATIVDEGVAAYLADQRARSATPALSALRRHVEVLREEALREAGGDAERATHILIQRLLHAPSVRLREMAADGGDVASSENLIRTLFGIAPDGNGKE